MRTNLESLKKEAKRWLDSLQAGDAESRARFERAVPGNQRQEGDEAAADAPTLRDVQHALAREHGFTGWPALKEAAENWRANDREAGAKALARYQTMAEALLEAYRTGTPEAMERHYQYTWHRRRWQAMRAYVQLDLGKRPSGTGGLLGIGDPKAPGNDVEITIDDARHLVAVEYGFANWAALEAFTKSSRSGPRIIAKPVWLVTRHEGDDGTVEWERVATSRDRDELLQLIGEHPSAGLGAQGQMTDEWLDEVSRSGTLTGLGLSGCRGVTDEGLRHLARLPALQHLDLSGTSITDAGLQVLRHLPKLRTLSLAGTRVTDGGMSALAYCHDLEDLNLAATQAGDGALRPLAGKARLHQLAIALTDAGIPLLHELPVFKTWQRSNDLLLRGTFTDRGMHSMKGLDGLFSLNIDEGSLAITAAGLEPLASLGHLTKLMVDAKDDWMAPIAAMPHLRHLSVQDTVAGDEGFVALSRSQSITHIWGRRCHNLRRRGFVALAVMPALQSLSVSCLNVDDEGVSVLPAFPALRELMPMDIPDAGYRHIAKCERLEKLTLMYCRDTTDAATEHITGLRHLTDYFNSYTTITDRTPELLSTMDSLERVIFDVCHGLTNAGIGRLARLPHLREVRASGNQMTAEAANAFSPAVKVSVGG